MSLGLAILGGILFGYMSAFLMTQFNFTLSGIMYWAIAVFIGWMIDKYVEKKHILYTIIAGFAMVLSFTMIETIPTMLTSGIAISNYQFFFNPYYYLMTLIDVINPFNIFYVGLIYYVIQILILVIGTYLGVRQTR